MSDKKCSCEDIRYELIDAPVRKFVEGLHEKNICTHSAEGGGRGHGSPDFAYAEVYLTKMNLKRASHAGLILDKVYDTKGNPLFFGSGMDYGRKTGFYLVGLNRTGLSDSEVQKKLCSLLPHLERQRPHKKWRSFF